MFSVVVSVLIAVVILADDAMRRQAATGQGNLE
jgi:hypothetical protein